MITRRCFKYWRYTHCAKRLLLYAVPIQLVMSPMDSQEEFRGGTPYYADYACREEAQVAARERGTTEECLDTRERGGTSLVESLSVSDIAAELARIFLRLESMEKVQQGLGQWHTGGQAAPPRDMFSGGRLGLRDKPQDQTQGQTL